MNHLMPLSSTSSMVRHGIALPLLALCRAGRCNQVGIDNNALTTCQSPSTKVNFDGPKDLHTKYMLIRQAPEGQDRI